MSKPDDKKAPRVNTKDQTTPPEPVKVGYDVEPVKVGYDVKGGKKK
jgi:hypothetical protein